MVLGGFTGACRVAERGTVGAGGFGWLRVRRAGQAQAVADVALGVDHVRVWAASVGRRSATQTVTMVPGPPDSWSRTWASSGALVGAGPGD